VVLAAIWDLLTMQCDRHGQNVYIDEDGHLTLIDLDQSFGEAWRICGYDSLFLPYSQKHAINHLGYFYAMKIEQGGTSRVPNNKRNRMGAQAVMDYRCHAPGGQIGFNYPPKVSQCLKSISAMSVSEVRCCEALLCCCDVQ
jgi:hypothetical protein